MSKISYKVFIQKIENGVLKLIDIHSKWKFCLLIDKRLTDSNNEQSWKSTFKRLTKIYIPGTC